jgi:hypothetical protein
LRLACVWLAPRFVQRGSSIQILRDAPARRAIVATAVLSIAILAMAVAAGAAQAATATFA